MQFGLWVEPEMINADSETARAHPDWIAGPGVRRSPEWRTQQVLDLANPDAFAHVLGQLDDLLTTYPGIAYLKWDQNRDQTELGSRGRSSVHEQTRAAYRLLDELRRRHPGLEIESCSSGGARVDLGILQRTDRVWASDTNDALERQQIQRGTHLLLPPELVGSHIGPTRSHSTARTHDLSFRAATALIGHTGIEWDFRETDSDERAELTRAIACYRERRALLHSGTLVHADDLPDTVVLSGVVSEDRRRAVFVWAVLAATATELPPAMMLPGLDPERVYRVRPAVAPDPRAFGHRVPPPWFAEGSIEITGSALEQIGLPMPVLHPEHALVFDVEALS
jgi:alpha-galactosidase